MHGGTESRMTAKGQILGLSPRARGNQAQVDAAVALAGSIPACTGEPTSMVSLFNACRVYPRVHGGTQIFDLSTAGDRGLSPRARGNRLHMGPNDMSPGSIPACTGEPVLACTG